MIWVTLSACLGAVLVVFDSTLINAVFPAALKALGRDMATTSWLINASNSALATGLLVAGGLAETFGYRRMYVVGTLLFGVASAASVIAPGFWTLLALRVAIGAAGAVLMVCSLALIAEVVPSERRSSAIGLYGALSGLGSVLGPLAGAFVLARSSWQVSFLFTTAGAIATLALIHRFMPRSSAPRAGGRVDWITGMAGGAALCLLVLGLSRSAQADASRASVWTAICAAGVAGAFALMRELRSRAPLFPAALRTPGYGHALLLILALSICFGTVLFAVPLFTTTVQGKSTVAAGLTLVPAAVLSIIGALVGGRLARASFSLPAGLGLALALLAVFVMSGWNEQTSVAAVWICTGISGFGLGMGIPSAAGYALQQAGSSSGTGSAWYQTFRQVGIVTGVAIFAATVPQRFALDVPLLWVGSICAALGVLWMFGTLLLRRAAYASASPQ